MWRVLLGPEEEEGDDVGLNRVVGDSAPPEAGSIRVACGGEQSPSPGPEAEGGVTADRAVLWPDSYQGSVTVPRDPSVASRPVAAPTVHAGVSYPHASGTH